MDDFSIWDQLRACLPCTRPSTVDSDDDIEARGAPELDRLLFDSEHDATDAEADAMSLHSNIGTSRTRGKKSTKKKRRTNGGKTVRVFGYDLFGHPRPPTPSPPPSDDEISALGGSRTSRSHRSTSGSLDADAAPLPDSTIANLSSDASRWEAPLTDEQLAREEEEQREREERRARRAARRLRKQELAEAEAEAQADLAAGLGVPPVFDKSEFEGFPGGNATLARDAFPPQLNTGDEGEFGPYVEGVQVPREEVVVESEDEADAGGEYNRRSKASTHSGSGGSSSRSRTRKSSSITDGSLYAPRSRRAHASGLNLIQQQQAPYNTPLPPSSAGSHYSYDHDLPPSRSKKSKSHRKNSSIAHSQSSVSTSQSPSIQSPGPDSPSYAVPQIRNDQSYALPPGAQGYEARAIQPDPSAGFPSTGFGVPGGKRSGLQGTHGVALARTGD